MADKRELILEYIIREYINKPEPVGSEHLKLRLDIKISSATIRNYFKKMVEEGELEQPHISAGRVPSNQVLKKYWVNKLLPLSTMKTDNMSHLKESAKDVGLFCMVRFFKPNRLQEILPVQGRFLLAVFDEGEIVINYSPEIAAFLHEMLHMDITDIRKVAAQVRAIELVEKIDEFLSKNPIERGGEELVNVARDESMNALTFEEVAEGRVIDRVNEGIYFKDVVPEGYMAIKQDIIINDEEAKIFFLGKLYKDFERFYKLAQKENNESE